MDFEESEEISRSLRKLLRMGGGPVLVFTVTAPVTMTRLFKKPIQD
jgi:hypothetical protein